MNLDTTHNDAALAALDALLWALHRHIESLTAISGADATAIANVEEASEWL